MWSTGNSVLLRVLGPIELVGAGEIDLLSSRLRRLLAALLATGGSVVSVDRLVDTLWGEALPEDPDAALHSLVARLRARLRAAAGPSGNGGPEPALLTRSPGYLLQVPTERLDATQFEGLAAAARTVLVERPAEAEQLFDDALGLWRGPAYAEFADEDFARPEAARLEELRLTAEEDRIEAALRSGRHSAATAQLEALLAREPLRERPHRQFMLAHYRGGRQADALAVARSFRVRLIDELGLDPSPQLQRLEEQILRQDAQLDWVGEPAGQPPIAPRAGGDTVPWPRSAGGGVPAMLGRDDDLSDLVGAVQPGSLVTLTGPGGVGKTTLARAATAQLASRFPDGVVTVELAAVATGQDVPTAVMTALAMQPRAELGPIERVVRTLAGRQLLLVLDNCEHVLDGAAELADAVVHGCPGVALLATSRAPLDSTAEQVWAVPPLATPPPHVIDTTAVGRTPAAQLFVERASARNRNFRLDDGNAAVVAEVCRRLDGLPLALELAAARMAAMTPADLVDRLSWRFRLLRGGDRAPERHRTLRAVVDWSFELLDDQSQRAFEVVSVFAGTFSLEEADQLLSAAADVIGSGDAGAETVLSLVDRSMVAVTVSGAMTRYVLLDTLRAYGREQLAARSQTQQVRRAHAELFAGLAEEADRHLFEAGHVVAVERLGAAVDELRVAWSWALEHDLALAVRLVGGLAIYVEHRMPAEVAGWAEQTVAAVDRATGQPLPAVAKLLGVAAAGARFAGDLGRARHLLERGLALTESVAVEAYLRYLLAEVALFEGRLSEVDALAATVSRLPVPRGLAQMVELISPLPAAYRGDLATAVQRAEELYANARTGDRAVLLGWTTYVLAEVLIDIDPDRAQALLLEALNEAAHTGDRYLTGAASVAAAAVTGRHGDPAAAAHLFLDVIGHWSDLGDWLHQWTTLRNVVNLLVRVGRDQDAAVLHGALTARENAAPIYGEDAERMAAARDLLESRLGNARLAELSYRGRLLADADVVALARTALGAQLLTTTG